MTNTKSLSERLRDLRYIADEAAAALRAKDAEIEKWQKLAGQGVAIEHDLRKTELQQSALLAQAAAALERIVDVEDASSGSDRGDLVASREIAREALAAIRAKEHP
jgi:ribosomal protein L5